jgi:hypothetical protein
LENDSLKYESSSAKSSTSSAASTAGMVRDKGDKRVGDSTADARGWVVIVVVVGDTGVVEVGTAIGEGTEEKDAEYDASLSSSTCSGDENGTALTTVLAAMPTGEDTSVLAVLVVGATMNDESVASDANDTSSEMESSCGRGDGDGDDTDCTVGWEAIRDLGDGKFTDESEANDPWSYDVSSIRGLLLIWLTPLPTCGAGEPAIGVNVAVSAAAVTCVRGVNNSADPGMIAVAAEVVVDTPTGTSEKDCENDASSV